MATASFASFISLTVIVFHIIFILTASLRSLLKMFFSLNWWKKDWQVICNFVYIISNFKKLCDLSLKTFTWNQTSSLVKEVFDKE